MPAITIDEIARLAGVSKTTVSRVLNNKPDVSQQTRETIMALIEQYDFHPHALAKAISLQKSQSIGLIIPHEAQYIFSNPFYVEVMRGVSTEVDRLGYYLLICYPHSQNYVDIYKQKRVDGFIILSPGSLHKNIFKSLYDAEAPFISTSMIPDEKEMVYVDVDNKRGARLAMEHLISLGHRRIAFIGKPRLASSIERLNGYRETLQEHGIAYDDNLVMISGDASISGGCSAAHEMLRRANPTAFFLVNDLLAMGAIKAIQESGLNVPRDVSVIGFDDIPLSECIYPPLTTIRQPAFEKGVRAARLLVQYLEKKKKPKSQLLDVDLVVRNSTAAVRS
ncbi:MAG: LacI family DNA-binding transcriptional regulator [Anaerolineae bacterium]|nr:LacI family DNA-binding transcriptional regulator [Anaerolineae bacterium]